MIITHKLCNAAPVSLLQDLGWPLIKDLIGEVFSLITETFDLQKQICGCLCCPNMPPFSHIGQILFLITGLGP